MRGITNKNFKKYYLAIIFAVVLILLPTHLAKAGWLANWTIEHTFGYVLFLVFSIAGKMIGALATLLNWAIHIPVYPDGGIAVIDESWKIMRNFANMFFIVALIMMAFATIFDVIPAFSKYNARALFGKFLFTALLINFSLVLGIMVIQGTQVLSNTFLTAIGDMANRLGQDLNPSDLFPKNTLSAGVALDSIVFGTLATLIFSIILIFTYLFSILTAFIFTFIRIPILWALLIVSPIAWILNVFPAGQGTFKKWWSLFVGWNMFLPIYLFFLYFGLYFLSNQKKIIQSIASQVSTAKIGESLPFSLELVFFYMLTAIFMIGGTIVAMKASMFSGTRVVGVAKWSRGVAARRLGLTAVGGAATQKLEQVKKEGLPTRFGQMVFGGERALELETARRARQLGVKGALEKGVEIEKEKQKPFANDINRLRELAKGGSREQMLAARTRLTELGDQDLLTEEEINKTLQMAGGTRSELGNKYLLSIDNSQLTEATRKWISRTVTNIEILKKNAIAMIEKDKISQSEIQRLAGHFLNDTEKRDFLNKGQKKNLLAVANARMNLGLSEAKNIDDEVVNALKKMSDDQILEIEEGDFKDPAIKSGLERVLKDNPGRLENMARRASGDKHLTLSAMAKIARIAKTTEQVAPLTAKKQRIESQIATATQEKSVLAQKLDQLKNYPTSEDYKKAQRELESKEKEITSLQDKADKMDERIEDVTLKQQTP